MSVRKTSSVKTNKTTPLKTTKKANKKNITINFSTSGTTKSVKAVSLPYISDIAKQSVNNITNKLKLGSFTKEVAKDYPSILQKSQNHLIGLIKFYEGNSENYYEGYTATYRDKGEGETKTNGFGSTTNLNIKNMDEAYLQLEKDLVKANNAVIKCINTDLKLGKGFFESLPASIREGLIDLCFNKGPGVILKNKDLINGLKNKDFTKIIQNLSYLYSIHDEDKKNPLPGLYRRSLSRLILSARDLSGEDLIQANKVIDKLYKDAVSCYKNKNIDTKDLDNVYSYYKSKSCGAKETSSTSSKTDLTVKTDSETIKSYKINQEKMGIFSIAKSMRPNTNGTVDSTKLLKAIMYEIIKLNKLKYDGEDENGYPKTSLQTNGTVLKLPTKINFENKSINLNQPANMEYLKQTAKTGSVSKTQRPAQAKTNISKTTKSTSKKKVSAKQPVSAKIVKRNPQQKTVDTKKSSGQTTTASGNEVQIKANIEAKSENVVSRFFKGLFSAENNKESHNKKEEIEEYGFDNDPKSTPFNLIMNDKNKKIKRNKSIIKFKDGKRKDYTIYTISLDYKVKKFSEAPNETVWGISHRYGINMSNFCENNNITDPSYISAGQTVKIQKLAYKVENGDDINRIAKKFGLTPDILMQLNGFDDGDISNIKPGQFIELPGFIYKVKKGDTFESIAEKVGVDSRILKHINCNKLQNNIIVLYNNPDYDKTLQSVKTVTSNGQKIEKIDMSGLYKEVATREHLRYKTKVNNGLVVANRAEFAPTNANGKLKGRTIIVNAGHGYGQYGRDPGAIFEKNGLEHEWILNYDNSMRLIAKLQAQGARVIYLQGHRYLIQKALKQPENKGDLFISVHANIGKGDDTTKDRPQFYYRENVQPGEAKENSIRFANIAKRIFNTKYKNDKYSEVSTNDERTGVLKTPVNNGKIGGIIWEVAFMDSPKGRQRLQDNRTMNDYAYLMAQAVVKYFESDNINKTKKN